MPAPASADNAGSAPGARSLPSGRRRWPRILIAVALALAALIGLLALGGTLFAHRLESAYSRGTLLDPNARAGAHDVSGPMNFLLIGSDYRTTDPSAGQRSDTIIVVHLTRSLDHVYLVSIPRDLLVTIPPDPSEGFAGSQDKINSAFDVGNGGPSGIQLLSKTLNNLSGLRFDGAFAIRFDGLKHAVDLLGGVNMCVDVSTTSIHTGRTYPVGCRLMKSADVLDYLRQREQYPDGDYTRQRHEQQFLKAMLERAGQQGVLTNPVKLDQFDRAVAEAMTVDTGDYSLADLAFGLRGIRPNQMTGVKVPSYGNTIDQTAYVIATADADGLYSALRSDDMGNWVRQHAEWVNGL